MIGSSHVILITASAAVFATFFILIIRRCFLQRFVASSSDAQTAQNNSLQNGIRRLHQVSPLHSNHLIININKESSPNSYSKELWFSWADHPSLVAEAVESGWSRFAFTTYIASQPVNHKSRDLLSGINTEVPANESSNVEISWEVCEGSSDYMQKVRLNPNLKKKAKQKTANHGLSVIKTALPLPGPMLGNNGSFPQEAYFEITILNSFIKSYDSLDQTKGKMDDHGDKIKLIEEDYNKKITNSPESVITKSSHNQRKNKNDVDLKHGKLLLQDKAVLVSVGLTTSGHNSLPLKVPGSYQGSVGFHSTGSVYLDGTEIICESKTDEWFEPDKVVGCGYNPSQRKVFFTVDSQRVHEIHCKTDDFASPLYPILASNASDVAILVNLGQSPFKYLPANSQRTLNPCFIAANYPASLGFEDSKELFSMERIDSQWRQRSAGLVKSNNNTVSSVLSLEEYDVEESESDLFEIVLDHIHTTTTTTVRSP